MASDLRETTNSIIFGPIREIRGDPLSNYIVSVGEDDGRIQLLTIEDFSPASNQIIEDASNEEIKSVAFSSDAQTMFCGGESKNLIKFSWPDPVKPEKIYQAESRITRLSSGAKGTIISIICDDETAVFFDYSLSKAIGTITVKEGIMWSSMSPSGKYFAYVSNDLTINVLELNDGEISEKMKKQILESKHSQEELEDKERRKEIDLPIITAAWGYPSYLIVGNSEKSSAVEWFDIEKQEEMTLTITDISTPIVNLSVSPKLMAAALDKDNTIHVFNFPTTTDFTSITCSHSRKVTGKITCIGWCLRNVLGGNEDGEAIKWSMDDEEEKKDEEKEDDFISDDEEEEMKEAEKEKEAPKKTKKSETVEGFGSLKSSMKDVFSTAKKVTKKAKSNAKQQKLDLGMVAKVAQSTPKAKPAAAPAKEPVQKPKQIENLISDSDEEESSKEEEEVKKGVSIIEESEEETKKPDFIESDSDEEPPKPAGAPANNFIDNESESSDEKTEEQKKPDFIDSESDSAPQNEEPTSIVMPSSSSASDAEEKAAELPKYEETSTKLFMPTQMNSEFKTILSWNRYYIMIKAQNELGIPYVKLFKQETGLEFITIDGPEALDATIGCTSEDSLLLVSPSSYYYRQFFTKSDISEIEEGDTIFETKGTCDSGETFVLGAIGTNWFALVTNTKKLHIFVNHGTASDVLALESHPITMVGNDELLFIVTGGYHKFEILNIPQGELVTKGYIAGKQPLKWIGFDVSTEEAFTQSGDGVIYCLQENKGSYWTPYYDLKEEFSSIGNKFYTAFIDGHKLYGNLYNEENTITDNVPTSDYNIYNLIPKTLDPKNAIYLIKSDKNDENLYKLFTVAIDARNRQNRAYQIASLITNVEIRNAAINYALMNNALSVAERLQNDIEAAESSFNAYSNKPVHKMKFIRTQPPPEIKEDVEEEEDEKESEEENTRIRNEEAKRQREEKAATIAEEKNSFFKKAALRPKMDSEEELLNDLESAPAPKKKETSQRKRKSSKKSEEGDNEDAEEAPKKTKRQRKAKKGADDSDEEAETPKKKTGKAKKGADDSDEETEKPKKKRQTKRRKRGADDSSEEGEAKTGADASDEEVEEVKPKKKKPALKKRAKAHGIQKPQGVADISAFGFTKKV